MDEIACPNSKHIMQPPSGERQCILVVTKKVQPEVFWLDLFRESFSGVIYLLLEGDREKRTDVPESAPFVSSDQAQ